MSAVSAAGVFVVAVGVAAMVVGVFVMAVGVVATVVGVFVVAAVGVVVMIVGVAVGTAVVVCDSSDLSPAQTLARRGAIDAGAGWLTGFKPFIQGGTTHGRNGTGPPGVHNSHLHHRHWFRTDGQRGA